MGLPVAVFPMPAWLLNSEVARETCHDFLFVFPPLLVWFDVRLEVRDICVCECVHLWKLATGAIARVRGVTQALEDLDLERNRGRVQLLRHRPLLLFGCGLVLLLLAFLKQEQARLEIQDLVVYRYILNEY